MQKVTLFFEKAGEKNYWCYMDVNINNTSVFGNGTSVRKALDDFHNGLKEAFVDMTKDGVSIPTVNFEYKMDVGSFFNYYPINITAFAQYIGMNASLLRQYVSGLRTPKAKALQKIKEGINKFKQDISPGSLIEKPLVSY